MGGFVYDWFIKGERPVVGLGFSDHLKKGWSVKRGSIK
jgi:hypothetical protein